MYLNPSEPRGCLTNAYAIMISRPENEVYLAPNSAGKVAMAKAVYDKHKKSERSEIASISTPVTEVKQSKIGVSNTGARAMSFLEAGCIVSAAEKTAVDRAIIGDSNLHWARFCYHPERGRPERGKHGVWVIGWLYEEWSLNKPRETRLKPQVFRDLAGYCVLDTEHRLVTGKRLWNDADVCRGLGYKNDKEANWSKTFEPHWNFMCNALGRLDQEVIGPVIVKLSELRWGKREAAGRV